MAHKPIIFSGVMDYEEGMRSLYGMGTKGFLQGGFLQGQPISGPKPLGVIRYKMDERPIRTADIGGHPGQKNVIPFL
jgi:hypothetical protein